MQGRHALGIPTTRALAVVDDWAAGERGDGSGADLVRAVLDARLGVVL